VNKGNKDYSINRNKEVKILKEKLMYQSVFNDDDDDNLDGKYWNIFGPQLYALLS
jgi:hypothetical protein